MPSSFLVLQTREPKTLSNGISYGFFLLPNNVFLLIALDKAQLFGVS